MKKVRRRKYRAGKGEEPEVYLEFLSDLKDAQVCSLVTHGLLGCGMPYELMFYKIPLLLSCDALDVLMGFVAMILHQKEIPMAQLGEILLNKGMALSTEENKPPYFVFLKKTTPEVEREVLDLLYAGRRKSLDPFEVQSGRGPFCQLEADVDNMRDLLQALLKG